LDTTLQEEKKADQTLTKIAESAVNRMAAQTASASVWIAPEGTGRAKRSFGSWGFAWIPLARRLGLRRLATDALTIKRIRGGKGLSYISRDATGYYRLRPAGFR
jgi:hypothetical protein